MTLEPSRSGAVLRADRRAGGGAAQDDARADRLAAELDKLGAVGEISGEELGSGAGIVPWATGTP